MSKTARAWGAKKLAQTFAFVLNLWGDIPLASPPDLRIKTLKEANKKGIKIFGFISPVLPGITNLEEIFRELSSCGCKYVWVELLNTRRYILNKFIPLIKKNFPNKVSDFEFAIKNPDEYFKIKEKEVNYLKKKYNLKVRGLIKH